MGQFRHMIGSDQSHFWQELKLLRRQYRALNIVLITAGETLNVNGTDLYTMELEIKNLPCHAYMLLREQGDFGDAAKTPYFFRSRETRDKTIRYLMKPKRSNDGIESNCDWRLSTEWSWGCTFCRIDTEMFCNPDRTCKLVTHDVTDLKWNFVMMHHTLKVSKMHAGEKNTNCK